MNRLSVVPLALFLALAVTSAVHAQGGELLGSWGFSNSEIDGDTLRIFDDGDVIELERISVSVVTPSSWGQVKAAVQR